MNINNCTTSISNSIFFDGYIFSFMVKPKREDMLLVKMELRTARYKSRFWLETNLQKQWPSNWRTQHGTQLEEKGVVTTTKLIYCNEFLDHFCVFCSAELPQLSGVYHLTRKSHHGILHDPNTCHFAVGSLANLRSSM